MKRRKLKPPRVLKPRLGKLKKILQGYVSPSVSDRLNALQSAVLWYEAALPYVLSKPELVPEDIELKARLAEIADMKAHAIAESNAEVRAWWLRDAILRLESCCAKLKPSAASVYFDLYDARKEKFNGRATKLENRFAKTLQVVEQALGLPFAVKYCDECQQYRPAYSVCSPDHAMRDMTVPLEHVSVESRSKVARRFHPGLKRYFLNKQAAVELYQSMKREGAAPALLRELRLIGHAAASEPGVDGKSYVVNRDCLLAVWEQGLVNLETWLCKGESPYKLTRQKKLKKGESK